MRRFLITACLIFGFALALPATAQEEADDKTYLENLLQDALSGDGHTVQITGFSGALSSQAQMNLLTIADGDGVWLTMRDATLIWSRSALLGGHLDVTELSAQEITIARLPNSSVEGTIDASKAQAGTFALPDLPVSVDVQKVELAKVILGPDVIGEAATLAAIGSFALDEGAGQAALDIQRLDRQDRITFEGSFSNTSRVLALDLNFEEASDGLVSALLRIPDSPALTLTVQGEAPVSDYVARVALSSDGVRRFGGNFTISALSDEAEIGYEFGTNLTGDVRPLFAKGLHPFFGENAQLDMAGRRFSNGQLLLDRLDISSGALEVNSEVVVAPDGWPERFALNGEITSEDPVRLPISGEPVTVEGAEFVATYNAAQGEGWTTTTQVTGFARDGLTIRQAEFKGGGTIDGRGVQQVSADLEFAARGIRHRDAALSRAVGKNAAGSIKLDWRPDSPIDIGNLLVVSEGTILRARGTVGGLNEGFTTQGEATLIANDLTRFQDLADRQIRGTAEAQMTGKLALLGGAFDMQMRAITRDLQVDEPRLDPVLTGVSTLEIDAARTPDGTFLRQMKLRNDAISADASGRVDADAGTLDFKARLNQIALVEPQLTGPATVDSAFSWQAGEGISVSRLDSTLGDARLTGTGSVNPEDPDLPMAGKLTLSAPTLGRFARLAGRSLSGSITLNIEGDARLRARQTGGPDKLQGAGLFDVQATANMRDLRLGEARLDGLLKGPGTLKLDMARDASGSKLRQLILRTEAVTAELSGQMTAQTGAAKILASLSDIGRVEPRLKGPANVDGALTWQQGQGIDVSRFEARLGETTASASGRIDPEDSDLPFDGKLALSSPSLSRFAGLLGRPLAGAMTLDVSGDGRAKAGVFNVKGKLQGNGFRTGMAEVDRLLAGSVEALFSGSIGDGLPDLRYVKLVSPRISVNASGDGPGGPIAVTGRLSDLALLAPGFPGPVTARGTLNMRDREGRQVNVALDATGPGGTSAQITGAINQYGKQLALDVQGAAPLGLINRFIEPRSVQGMAQFDLRVDGPPHLNSLSGSAAFQGARVALPKLNYSLNNLNGTAQLAAGRAEINVTGDAGTGGQFNVTGPVQLTPGFPGNLTITLSQLGLFDPTLYETTISGTLNVSGNLTGGAGIGGALNLGPTELRVPSGSGTVIGTLPDIKHLYEPAAVRTTRDRAGLIKQLKGSAAVFPIDVMINAPSRIFVRGRGLDAELGGAVRITGTTADMRPAGVFKLIRGRLDLLGKRLDLTEGLIDLRGALNPYLRFVAETEADDVTVLVILEGLASAPEVTFSSIPELPQEEVVARLLFGRDLASISAFQAAQLVSAVATLSGRYQGGITGRLRDSLGLSDLDITTTQDGATQFTAGAYIADNIYSEVVADSDGNQEINLNLDVSKYVTIKGRVNNEGNTGIGVFFEKDY